MFRFFQCAVFSVLFFSLITCSAYGAVLSYDETFDGSTKRWESGYLIPEYSLWHIDAYQVSTTKPNVRMTEGGFVAGTMTLAVSLGDSIYSLLGASSLLPTATAFDLSAGDLVFEADLASNWRSGSVGTGGAHAGLRVNDLIFLYHPGYSGGGAFRIERLQADGSITGIGVGNQNMGFVPGSADADNQKFTQVRLTVSQDADQYVFKFESGLKEAGAYTYSYEHRAAVSDFANGLSEVGIFSRNGININVDNFAISAPFSDADYAKTQISDAGKGAWNAAIAADNPLHWYRFDAKAGDVVLKDYGSAPADGRFSGLAETSAVFNGVNTFITLDAGTIAGDWAAEFIVNVDKSKSNSAIVGNGSGALKIIQGAGGDNSHPGFTRYGVRDYRFTAEPGQDLSYPGDEWLHMVYTRDTALDITSLYVNGELIGTTADSIDLFLGTIGASGGGDAVPFDFFKGSIDEAVFYSVVLSATDVQAHYAAYQNQSSSAVPEPATWLMLLVGLAGLMVARRRSR